MVSVVRLNALSEVIKKYEEILMKKGVCPFTISVSDMHIFNDILHLVASINIKWKKFYYKFKKNHNWESWARARLAEICLIDYHTIEDGLRVIIKYMEVGFNRVSSPDMFDLLMQNSKGELSHQVLSERFPELNVKDDKDDSQRKDDANEFDSDRDDDESYDYDGKDKRDKDRRKKRRKRAHMVTCDPYLLLSFVYFDQTHCGYLLDKDIEEILQTLGLMLSRAQTQAKESEKSSGKYASEETTNDLKV